MAPPYHPPSTLSASEAAGVARSFFTLTLHIPPGEHAYKFLVDGVWSTDDTSTHPVRLSRDGVRQHVLVVSPMADVPTRPPMVTMTRMGEIDPRSTAVFRSASASVVPSLRGPIGPSSSTSLHEVPRRTVEVAPRGSSFNAPPPANSLSATASANRRSLLLRVGSGWMKRFSSKGDDFDRYSGMDHSFGGTDRGASSLFRGREKTSLFPSASDPSVGGREIDKENSFRRNGATPDRYGSRRGIVRGSARSQAVKISMPTKVDEPRDKEEVDRQADNWRKMARHLQDDLFDPSGARKLFIKAIQHREKHGMFCTSQNAQIHVDLARNLSKAEQMKEAELHLRIALKIYNDIDAGVEHIADLLLYVGVVVDRQKRRKEAEELYRKALDVYKQNNIAGNNVEIAVKNLSLNLRKQNREAEVGEVRREFLGIKGSSVIV